MIPMSTTAGGVCFAMPDVCKTPAPPAPPVPIPYPNIAQLASATGTAMKVMVENKPVIVEGAKVPNSQGDEAGTAGGVVSGTNMGPAQFKMGSSKVTAQGKAVVFLGGMTAHNGSNANAPAGTIIAPSQAKVLVMP